MASPLMLRAASVPLRLEQLGIPPLNWPPEKPFRYGTSTELQALILDHGDARLVLLGADLLWFCDASTAKLRPAIAEKCGVEPAAVSLTATHTHGTSQSEPRFDLGHRKDALRAEIERAALAAVDAALVQDAVAVRLQRHVTTVGDHLTVNRRRKAWYLSRTKITRRVQNMPNRKRPVDRRLTSLFFRDDGGQVRAVINHFTCHGVTDAPGVAGADYPGHLRAALHAALPDAPVVMFLQGFCGDVRPDLRHLPIGPKDHLLNLILGARFRLPNDGESAYYGEALAKDCLNGLKQASEISVKNLAYGHRRLAMADMAGRPLERALDITTWRLGPDCRIVFASGEMLSGLAPDDGVLSVGYANGMVGYVAPPDAYAGGGYEIDGFRTAMALEARIAPTIGPEYLTHRGYLLEGLEPAS